MSSSSHEEDEEDEERDDTANVTACRDGAAAEAEAAKQNKVGATAAQMRQSRIRAASTEPSSVSANTQGSVSANTQSSSVPAKPSAGCSGRIFTRVIYTRVTPAEWQLVRKRAQGSGVSMSRYLVRAALTGRKLPSREERARLETMLYRLRRAAIRLRQLSALRWMQTADPETVEMMQGTAALLERLVLELTRRQAYGNGDEGGNPNNTEAAKPQSNNSGSKGSRGG